MNKSYVSLLVAVAICYAALRASSQEYLTDVNHDRATVSITPPNVLGLLPVGGNYLRIYAPKVMSGSNPVEQNVLELVRIGAGNPDDGVWNYSGGTPATTKFTIYVNGQALPAADLAGVGFKRRGYYGDLKKPKQRPNRKYTLFEIDSGHAWNRYDTGWRFCGGEE